MPLAGTNLPSAYNPCAQGRAGIALSETVASARCRSRKTAVSWPVMRRRTGLRLSVFWESNPSPALPFANVWDGH